TGKCETVAKADGKVCDDSNACTSQSTCSKGQCQGTPDLACSDGNPCTDDSCAPAAGCVFTPNAAACDDKNPCTSSDVCAGGGCGGVTKNCDDGQTCTYDSCDPANGNCSNKPNDGACDDNNPCTTDTCGGAAGCSHPANDSASCDDGDPCTTNKCSGGQCTGTYTCQCKDDAGCNDNNPCTADKCAAGVCKSDAAAANGTGCDPADKCQQAGSGTCNAGLCTAGNKPIVCAVAGPCQTAACNPATGKCETVAKADGTACDADGNGCTADDKCASGVCAVGTQVICSAQNKLCQPASCTSTGANSHTCTNAPSPKGTACDDSKYCTTGETCDGAGACSGGAALSCSAQSDACNTGVCNEAAKACAKSPKASTVGCDDGQYCTTGDHCDGAGKCAGGPAPTCPGGNCLVGFCDATKGACATKAAAAGTACSDGSVCTTGDACSATGACAGQATVVCDDKNPCTTDSCDPAKGCTSKVTAGAKCDDGNACTTSDACDATGACVGSWTCQCKTNADCNDGNACTADACVSGKCSNTAVAAGTTCDDGDACSTASACNGTTCKATKLYDCSAQTDGCNTGTCYAAAGGTAACKKVPKASATACDDGLFCTTADACDGAGKCVGGPAPTCGKPATCFNALCTEAAKGCTTQPMTKGTACSDGNPCTNGDTCDGVSACAPGPALPDFTPCNDSNASTTGDSCIASTCNGFVMLPGPSLGPASRVAYQTEAAGWHLLANDAAAADETVSGSWKVFPSTAGTGGGKALVWGAATALGAGPLRAMANRVVLGNGNLSAAMAAGATAWTAGSYGKPIGLAISESVNWYAVDSRVVASNLIVSAVGTGVTTGNGWLLQCTGASSGVASSCAATSLAASHRPAAAHISTSTTCLSCAPTAFHHAVDPLANSANTLFTGLSALVAPQGTLSYAGTVGPALSAPVASRWFDMWASDFAAKGGVTGATDRWIVGPSGYVAYSKVGTTGLLAASVVASAQAGYIFRSVARYSGYVLIFGTKPDSVNKQSRRAVLLTHLDAIDSQSGATGWTEFDLGDAAPAWPTSSCAGNMMNHVDMDVANNSLLALANVCTGANVRRPVLYFRQFK
ncbi:MAG: hypothetical protein HY902_11600, partial [Deltaproteobacteria bacterium]|nr:hypothetical protein [Deltaproteobacteria bacterium]